MSKEEKPLPPRVKITGPTNDGRMYAWPDNPLYEGAVYVPESSLKAAVAEARASQHKAPKFLLRRIVEASKITGNGCVEFDNSVDVTGYARVLSRHAHRSIWEWLYGVLPQGMVLDHLCRNPKCINPEHLEPVTPKENTLRGIGPTAINSKKGECPNGHVLRGSNITSRSENWRQCRICRHARQMLRRNNFSFRGGMAINAAIQEQQAYQQETGAAQSSERIVWDAVNAIREAQASRAGKEQA